MHRFLFLSFLTLIAIAPNAAWAAIVDDTNTGDDNAITCRAGTYVCHCDERPMSTIEATSDSSVCLDFCSSSVIGADRWDLHCTSRAGTDYIQVGDDISYDATEEAGDPKKEPIIPTLNVAIPGLTFTPPAQSGGYTQVNFLAQYVDALYKLLMVICSVVVVVMIMIGGLQYILARGSANGIKQATDRIKNAVVGLVLLMSAYSIAFLLDPSTTKFAALRIESVPLIDLPAENDADTENYGSAGTVDSADLTTITNEHHKIVSTEYKQIGKETLAQLDIATEAYYAATQKNVRITSASRTLGQQAKMFYDNCIKTGGRCKPDTCNPARNSSIFVKAGYAWNMAGTLAGAASTEESRIVSAIVANGNAAVCQHTTNVAVDMWPEGAKDYIFDVAAMNIFTKIMGENGFCRISNEPWHFELFTKKSSSCVNRVVSDYTTKGITYSTSGCKTWNAKSSKNCCDTAVNETAKPTTMCK